MDSVSTEPSFYLALGGSRWRATSHTVGPWDPGAQHGGPPSALLGRAIESCAPREEMMTARFTCEILGAVPVGDLDVEARVVRPGRNVELVEAVMTVAGRDVARATAWRNRRTTASDIGVGVADPPPPMPDAAFEFPEQAWATGYLSAIEWRVVSGGLIAEPGPSTAWTRLRYPLVNGEEPTPLQRVLAVADSGNGASSELDLSKWLFINPELSVHLHREAVGEWVCLEARTIVSESGTGLATSVLWDRRGRLGAGAQSLLVTPRG